MHTKDDIHKRIVSAMKTYFGEDQRRIDHTLKILDYAEQILAQEEADEVVVRVAAVLHDIGIPEAERKHGSSAGRYQEIEGPPIARKIAYEAGLDEKRIEHVAEIVANHHSARSIDTNEFRIVWDADWLVNMAPEARKTEPERLKERIERIFKTETGKKIAYQLFITNQKGGE